MERINLVNIIVGKRGTGKSWFFLKNLLPIYRKAHPKKRVLIMDTLDHPAYRDIPRVNCAMLERWRGGGVYRIFGDDEQKILDSIEKNVHNALIVFEDASKYIDANLPDKVNRFVLDSKQKNLDLIFMFHGFSYCPPKLWRIADTVTIFKSDNPEYRKKEIVAYEDVKQSWNNVMADPNRYAQKTVRLQ